MALTGLFELMLLVGAAGGLLAAAMAWLIPYGEYAKHVPLDRRAALRAAFQTATLTFCLFVGGSDAVGRALGRRL